MIACCCKDCENLGRWVPGLMMAARKRHQGNPRHCALAMLLLPHCDDCRVEVSSEGISALITDEAWLTIAMPFIDQGKEPPVKEFSLMRWLELPASMEFEAGGVGDHATLRALHELAEKTGLWTSPHRARH